MTRVQKTLVKAIIDHINDMTPRIKDLDTVINGEMKKYEDAINDGFTNNDYIEF